MLRIDDKILVDVFVTLQCKQFFLEIMGGGRNCGKYEILYINFVRGSSWNCEIIETMYFHIIGEDHIVRDATSIM